MRPAGRYGAAVFRSIGRFDADHRVILLIAEVRHGVRLADPRIPDHGGAAVGAAAGG